MAVSAPDETKPVEARLNDWLGTGPKAPRNTLATSSVRVAKRKAEIARLEAKLEDQANALALTVARLKKARRSLKALQRAARKVRRATT